VAVLALSLAVVTASAGASNWHAASAGDAVAAKKKCKKKGKKSAAVAKKKKCKKKKKAITPPVVTPPKGPIQRILLTWSGAADLDVHAWANGLHDGWNEPLDEYEVQIPGTTYTNSANTPNQERIVELSPNPSNRPMTFGICYYAGVGGVDAGDTDLSVTTVFSSGETTTDQLTASYGESFSDVRQQGGPTDPVEDWCPFTM
jgi:hypothetical protein